MAQVVQESIGGRVGIGKGVLPDGSEIEVGVHRVKALGGRNFLSAAWTPFGTHDAEVQRAKVAGEKPPMTWAQKYEVARKRDENRREKEFAATIGGAAAATVVQTTAPLTGLAAQLAGFEDDEQMQLLIIKRWNEKRAEAKAAAVPVAPPATAVERVAEQITVTETPATLDPPAQPKGPVGSSKGPVKL